MNWGTIIPIALSVITALVVAFRRVFQDFATIIRLQTEMKEKINLSLVGIETLKIVDIDTSTQIKQLEQRISDLERFIQLLTAESERPFIVRYRDK